MRRRLRWIQAQPLIFGEASGAIHRDLHSFHDTLSLSARVKDLAAVGPEHQFIHRSSTLLAGDLAISSCINTPFQVFTEESKEATVVLHRSGAMVFNCDGRMIRSDGEEKVIYLPGAAGDSRVESLGSHGIVFNINPSLLAREICFLSRERLPLERALLFVQQPMERDPRDPAVAAVLRQLLGLLAVQPAHLSFSAAYQRFVGSRLEIAVYRATALLLRPDLIT